MSDKKSNVKNIKKRNWVFVGYPESLPSDWKQKLTETGLQIAISPLHDRDINPTGEPKKPHYHFIACYSGPTSYSVVKSLTDSLNCPIPQALEQVKGYYRYLIHLDNPEKAQYDEKSIQTINGFNILDFSDLTKSEVQNIKLKLQSLIRELNLYEYSDFIDFLADNEMFTEYEIASTNTYFFEKYICSRRNKCFHQQTVSK